MKKRNVIVIVLICCCIFIAGFLLHFLMSDKANQSNKDSAVQSTEKASSLSEAENISSNTDLLKQIKMLDQQTGWALTDDGEVLYTTTGTEHFSSIKKADTKNQNDNYVSAYFMDKQSMYLTYFLDGNIVIEYTTDAGETWDKTLVSHQEYGDANAAYISFVDEKNGYLLYCGTPGAGQMTKIIFQTTDGGKTYKMVSDITDQITGYPSGISFSAFSEGYISTTYHGEDTYLFGTTDSGVTWNSISLETYEGEPDVNYIESYQPDFFGEDKQNGKLILKYVGNAANTYIEYTTQDGGSTWKINGPLECDSIQSYSFINENEGYIIDESGAIFTKNSTTSQSEATDATTAQAATLSKENATLDLDALHNKVAEQLIEAAEIQTADEIRLDNLTYGSFSAPDKDEIMAEFVLTNPPHVAGLDTTITVLCSARTGEIITSEIHRGDDVEIYYLPTSLGQKCIFVLCAGESQGVSASYAQLYKISDNKWEDITTDDLQLEDDMHAAITSDGMLMIYERPYLAPGFGEIEVISTLEWNENDEKFVEVS